MRKNELRELNFVVLLIILFHFLWINESAADDLLSVKVGIPGHTGFYAADENGSPYGYGYKYLEAISDRAGFKYDFVHASWSECFSMLEKGEIDILNAVIFTPARAEIFEYCEYPTGISFGEIFIRENNVRIGYGDFKSMNGMRVGLLYKNRQNEVFFEYAAKNNFTTTNIMYYDEKSFSAALQNGDVDAIVSNNLRRNANEKPVARFSPKLFYIVTKKGNSELMNSINNAIFQILIENPNFNADLRRIFYPHDRSVIIFTEEERDFIKNSNVITIVYDKFGTPTERYDEESGIVVGINADIIRLISKKYGLRFEFLNGYSQEECIDMVANGRADMLLNYDKNHELVRQGLYESLSIVTAAPLIDELSFALHRGMNENVLNILNKAIASLSESEIEEILYEHMIIKKPEKISFADFYNQYKTLILSLAIAFLAIMSISFAVMLFVQLKNKKAMWKMAYMDPLTGIGNLNRFKIDAEYLIKNNPDTTYMIAKLDIDRFKFINEMYGFQEGDLVLINIAKAIEFIMDKNMDTFARIGSDEFIALKHYESFEQMEKVRMVLENKFFELHGKNTLIKFPTGRYVIRHGETDITKIFEKVNYAHRLAKQQKGLMLCHYDDNEKNAALYMREIETKMENALKEHKFLVYLQPKYTLSNESIVGAEALVRWEDGGKDLIYPNDFIPLFEQNGFIVKLDMYMVKNVCKLMNSWISGGIEPVKVSVNFSRLHLLDHISFLRELCGIVDEYNVPREYIEIEFTESVVFNNDEVFTDIFIRLRNEGFAISMDDFGTGYSSLGMLKNIPVDVIKMDRSFFTDLNDHKRAETVISHVMSMARSLDIVTVAEGVETIEQINMLRRVGCDIVQGYYYSKPLKDLNFTQLLNIRA